jgi:site-specific DNA-methyltransferase (adenine-specific)
MRAEINLIHGCSLKAMREMQDNAFDLAIVDPPYGIGAGGTNFKNGTSKSKTIDFRENDWDKNIPPAEYWQQLFRVSKNQIVWGGNYMTEYLPPKSCWLFWDKGTGDNSYADGELAWTSFDGAMRKITKSWVGANAKDEGDRIHPTQKPIYLYRWILDKYAKEGFKILDTHLGSGSIALACWDMNYDLTAFEIDENYHKKAFKRFEKHSKQMQLW